MSGMFVPIKPGAAVMPLPAMSPDDVDKVRQLEEVMRKCPQAYLETEHTIHAGVYSRTIKLPKDHTIAGVTIKIPTILILNGDVLTYGDGGQTCRITGYHVALGQAGRKQAFHALADTWMTMIFATDARDVEEAEEEFTDEPEMLGSRRYT